MGRGGGSPPGRETSSAKTGRQCFRLCTGCGRPQSVSGPKVKAYLRPGGPPVSASDPSGTKPRIGAVLIGRNEGARLVAALEAAQAQVGRMVYVHSGSTDGSVEGARAAGAAVVEL